MSTAPSRRGSSRAEPVEYGYREVPQYDARGRFIDSVREPLTAEDVLHPREGDFIVESNDHNIDCGYLAGVFRSRLAHDPHALVLSDVLIYWDNPILRHHAADVSVILGVRDIGQRWPSFHVAQEGVRPSLLIEITSPSTRSNDFRRKRPQYYRAGVPVYVIVDATEDDDHRNLEIIGYRRGATRYQRVPLSDEGRLWLDVVGVWLGSEDGHVVCYDAQGERIANYTQAVEDAQEAQVRAEQERQRAEQEKQRADEGQRQAEQERQRAEQEKQRADAAERRLRELEAELRRGHGEG